MSSRTVSKTYGTVSADMQKEMSGLDFVQGLVDGTLPLNTMAKTLGYDVTEVVQGRAVVTCKPNETHLNPFGTVHGGLAATLPTPAWDLPCFRAWTKAPVRRRLSSRHHSCAPLRRRLASSQRRTWA